MRYAWPMRRERVGPTQRIAREEEESIMISEFTLSLWGREKNQLFAARCGHRVAFPGANSAQLRRAVPRAPSSQEVHVKDYATRHFAKHAEGNALTWVGAKTRMREQWLTAGR
jgi:hypothetical protein